jgi:hypothetical protein
MDPDLVEVDAGVVRVDGGDELELGVVDDGLADGPAHAPTGSEHTDADHG